MKRICAFVLAVAMLLVAAGCNKTPASSGGTSGTSSSVSGGEGTTSSGPVEEEREKHDLEGKEFVIKTWTTELFDYTEGESGAGDATLQTLDSVEDELNCELTFDLVAPEAMIAEANAAIMAGEKYADVYVPILWNFAGFVTGGLAQDLTQIPNLDLSKPYWDEQGNEIGTLKGKQYFAVGSMNGSMLGGTGVVFFNKRILSETGLESPYDLVKNDQWTIQKFRDMAIAATKNLDGNGTMDENDQWGIAALDARHCLTSEILAANDCTFITKNDEGVLQYSMSLPKVTNALKLAQDLLFKDNSVLQGTEEVADVAFRSGKALFYPFYLWKLNTTIVDMEDDFGVVPFPKGEGQTEYIGTTEWNRSVIAVPSNLDETDLADVGLLLDAWAYYSQFQIPAYHEDVADRYLRDDESAEMLELIENSARAEYCQFVASNANPALYEATYSVMYSVTADPSLNPMVEIDKVTDKGKTAIRDFMNSLP